MVKFERSRKQKNWTKKFNKTYGKTFRATTLEDRINAAMTDHYFNKRVKI